MAQPDRPPRSRTAERAASGVAAAVAAAVHARSLAFGFTGLDDSDLVVDDQAFLARPASLLRAFGRAYMHVVDPAHAYYRPIVTASYVIDAQWSGARPLAYHATNVALHALAAALLARLLLYLAMPPLVAAAGALVFAVHPALVPAVAWIPGRNDSLLAVFALGAWLCVADQSTWRKAWGRALHFALFGLALLTKETAIALPAVWIAHAALAGPRPKAREAAAGPHARAKRGTGLSPTIAAWAGLVAARLVLSLWLRGAVDGPSALALARSLPVALASLGAVLFPVAPVPLAVPEDLALAPGVFAAAGLLAASALVPGVRRRVVALGVLAFVLLLAPALAREGTLVLACRLELPACGLLLAATEIARAAAFDRDGGGHERGAPMPPRLFAAFTAVAVLALVALDAGYEGAFHDRLAFAREAVDGSPHSALAHFCLGQAYQRDGDDDRALAEYRTSLALGPGEVVHNNVAVIYMRGARWADAERELRAEIALDPRYARAYENLAVVLRHEGRDDESREAAATAARLAAEP